MKCSERKEERMKQDTRLSMIKSEDLAGFSREGQRSGKAMGRSMESEWVVLSSRMPNSSSADARDGILFPGVVDYSGLRFLL